MNITGISNINFNVGTQLTTINTSGLSVFHVAKETFPYTYAGWYNVSDRLSSLSHCMNDSVEAIINFDITHNTVIRIREQDIVNQVYYPRQLQIQSFQGTSISKFDIQGLQVLDTYNNWYYINKMFTMTNNSTLLCSNKIMVDSNGDLNVFLSVGNRWINVGNNLLTSETSDTLGQINTTVNTIVGGVGAIATLASYFGDLQLTLAVTSGIVVGTGLLLAFSLKEDRFEVKAPLVKRTPISGEYFNQIELKFNPTLLLDNGVLTINTREFLTPLWGDLAMLPTPENITTSSALTYVVVKQLSQPITCMSNLNVSGYTTLNNNVTCVGNLSVNGVLYSSTTTNLNNNLNSISSYSNLNISNIQSTSTTIFNNLNSFSTSTILTLNNQTTTLSNLNNVVNALSGYSYLNLTNNINSLSSYSYLNISGLNNNINNLSTNSILAINGHTTQLSNLNNNINSLSSYSYLNINNLQATTTSLLNLINNVQTPATLNVNNLMVTGTSIFNNTVNMSKLLLGTDVYNYFDSVLEVNKNLAIRNNITTGSRIDLQTGSATTRSYISLEEGHDINISTPVNIGNVKSINLSTDNIILDANQVFVSGKIINSNGLNIGAKSPIYFTTYRNVVINGSTYSVYDINLIQYVKYITLDGYNIRQFRMRTWYSDADFQSFNMHCTRSDIFMSNRGGLNIYAMCMPFENQYLNDDKWGDQFLFRYDFNTISYCSRIGVQKVYCIIEDLL